MCWWVGGCVGEAQPAGQLEPRRPQCCQPGRRRRRRLPHTEPRSHGGGCLGFRRPIQHRQRPRWELVAHNRVDDPPLPSVRAPGPSGRVPGAQAPGRRLLDGPGSAVQPQFAGRGPVAARTLGCSFQRRVTLCVFVSPCEKPSHGHVSSTAPWDTVAAPQACSTSGSPCATGLAQPPAPWMLAQGPTDLEKNLKS
jgi:hypothetical protein